MSQLKFLDEWIETSNLANGRAIASINEKGPGRVTSQALKYLEFQPKVNPNDGRWHHLPHRVKPGRLGRFAGH